MGNKPTRSKSFSGTPGSKKRKKSKSEEPRDPRSRDSCPDFGGAVPYTTSSKEDSKDYPDARPRDVSVTIYRSYRGMGRHKTLNFKDGTEPVEYTFHRRSARFPEKPNTLPRNFGRSKSDAIRPAPRHTLTPNGDVPSFGHLPEKDVVMRSGTSSTRSSKHRSRASSANSSRMSGPVLPSHFPNTEETKRKLAQYEELFCKELISRFCDLPSETQLNSTIIAIDTLDRNRFVSLQEYIFANDDEIPLDLTSPDNDGRYVLTIPVSMFHGVVHVRRDKIDEPALFLSLAHDIVQCIAVEAVNELTRIYEYQIVLMFDEVAMRVIAQHAVECVMEHVRNKQFIDRNSVIHSVVNTYPPNEDGSSKYISGVLGTKELKWDLFDLYKKPGLRKELNIQENESLNDSGLDSPGMDFTPWVFCYSDTTDPFHYGYRGQTIEWDYIQRSYKLDLEEDQRFKRIIALQSEDFHRLYMPYKRLVGYEVMQNYCNKPRETKRNTLAQAIRTEPSIEGMEERDEIQPVYRPLSINTSAMNYDQVVLDNVDMTRANMKDTDLSETSAANAKLLLTDLDMTKVEDSNLLGADISYSNVQARELSPNSLKAVTARHVSLREAGDTLEGEPDTLGTQIDEDTNQNASQISGRSQAALMNSSFISDHDGNIFTIPEAISQQKARALQEEEERRRAAEEEARRAAEEQEKRILVVSEKINDAPDGAVVKPASKKKRRTKKKRVDEVAEFMNQTQDSETTHSVTNYNILDETPERFTHTPVHGQTDVRPESQRNGELQNRHSGPEIQNSYEAPVREVQNGYGAQVCEVQNGYGIQARAVETGYRAPAREMHQMREERPYNKSMDDVLDHANTMPSSSRYQYPNKSEEVLRRDQTPVLSYAPVHVAPPDALHNVSLPNPTRKMSPSPHDTSLPINGHGNRPINARYSTMDPRRQQKVAPRMVKSTSLHGHLLGAGKPMSMDPFDMGSLAGRRMLSQAELEYLRRSQIFTLLKGLHIENLEPMLPPLCDPFLGRKEQKFDIADLISASGRIILLTGCPGIGKSNLAIAVANELIKKFVNPVYIDCRTCRTVECVRQRLMITFGIYFKAEEMDYFYNWINSHEQRLLFLFDNLELNEALDPSLSEFIDNLFMNIKNLRILSTSVRQFFRGNSLHETYRVGDIRDYSDMILDMLVPDLHDDGKIALVEAADHVLYGVYLCGKAFSIANVDAGKLFEDLSSPGEGGLNVHRLKDAIYNFTTNELEQERLIKLTVLIRKVMEHLPAELVELMNTLCKVPGDFELSAAQGLTNVDSESVHGYIDELVQLGLLKQTEDRYVLPFVVKIVLENCFPDNGQNTTHVVKNFVDNVKGWTRVFNSVHCFPAIEQVRAEYTNLVCLLRWLVEHEDTYEYCKEFADLTYAMFLSEVLPQSLYEDLYDSLSQQADDADDVITKTNALCCLSYKCLQDEKIEDGKQHAENAYESLHAAHISEKEKAFCMMCLGKAYWNDAETKEKGLSLVRSSLDIYKQYYTLKDAKAIFANEEYGRMLVERESFQQARHIFNLSDLVMKEVLDKHPLLILSYDMRRSIWDKLFLFARATDISKKAVDVAKQFYGDHPITADMLVSLCECIMKRGSLQDAIETCIDALQIRIKVLGDQKDTALSYKTLSYLMLRSGQYDESIRFGQCALDIYEKIDIRERYKIDVHNIMTQAKHRLDTVSSSYLTMDSREGSRGNVADMHNQSCIASFSTEV